MIGALRCRISTIGWKACPVEIIGAVEKRGSGQQRQMLGALGQQAVEEDLVEALRREDGLGDALGRVLIEIDIGRAIGQVEIGEDGFGRKQVEMPQAQLWAMVEEPTPPLAPMKAIAAPSGSASGSTKIVAIAAMMSGIRDGLDHIFGNAVADQVAIERDVVVVADDDDLGRRVADGGERRQLVQQVRAARALVSRMIRFGVGAVENMFAAAARAAAGDAQADLRHAPVMAQRSITRCSSSLSQKACTEMRGSGRMFSSSPMRMASSALRSSRGILDLVFDCTHRSVLN